MFTFNFTEAQIVLIMEALSKLPLERSFDTFVIAREQFVQQRNPPPPPPAETAKEAANGHASE